MRQDPLSPTPLGGFSFFRRPIKNVLPFRTITLLDVCLYLTSEYNRETATQLALTEDPAARRSIKSTRLDYITPAGVFTRRAVNRLVKVSGLLVLDFDDVPDPSAFLTFLGSLPPLSFPPFSCRYSMVMAWISPSTHGVKVLYDMREAYLTQGIRTDEMLSEEEAKKAREIYAETFAHFERLTVFTHSVDISGKDIARACYLAPTLQLLTTFKLFQQWK